MNLEKLLPEQLLPFVIDSNEERIILQIPSGVEYDENIISRCEFLNDKTVTLSTKPCDTVLLYPNQ